MGFQLVVLYPLRQGKYVWLHCNKVVIEERDLGGGGHQGLRNSGIWRKFIAEYGILAISRQNDGLLHSYRTRIFPKMISGMRNFHEILWICGSFICCLVNRGRGHIFDFLNSTMRIFSKLCTKILSAIILLFPPGWVKMSNNTNLCHHFENKVAERGTLAKTDRNGGF